ncbi:cation/H(+) antiporter [Xanthomonas vesicatoria ATCC 35937]|uniref:Kef-type K+ transport system, membrane component n=1 Tax=Xanthomonas vesicatoria ATCC 35937 TaxID=925775 RepID=F0B953_9XANT|nr:cation:proton antiporter [Xanthomonas vesicatoria]APP76129.1 cation/H(+) antiporter [Xanthomonas vesicatoria ATCC 35937]EGD11010.1 Kef-type K+ transport system, membrane component [Xanthomonas vesicatoria ATCC 35937]KTF34010.1 Na+/H+-exchanging protein [Xanthomonas vesicatoria]MCC8597231.1 cation:proton antiporter [Xanthomonas vesicatoria]MCC8605653.1 cation:proton antiporter [Xanthomonas vesicatoria]
MNSTTLLLVQLAVILCVARLCGALLRRIGQPPVIGEMAAGLLLGPIAFGTWLPDLHGALFAAESLPPLSGLANLGVVLFMFIVGVELRAPEGTKAQVRSSVLVGVSGIVLPLLLGLAAAPWLFARFAPQGMRLWPFALFIAAAMSVTAFPVLARILKDRNMTRTPAGRLALGAAVIDDATVWIFLAIVLTLTGTHAHGGVAFTALGALALIALVFGVLKPAYARLLKPHAYDGSYAATALVWVLIGLLGCAAVAEWIGLHAIFGAFLFGICLPREDRLLDQLAGRIEPLAITLLMPVLFAVAGQATSPGAFAGAGIAGFLLVIGVAVAGKLAGCTVGARLSGHDWRDSLTVGSLMNARGLMELVVIKIGLDSGVIGPDLFTLLFGMTLITTVMTSPLVAWFQRRRLAVDTVALEGGRPGH